MRGIFRSHSARVVASTEVVEADSGGGGLFRQRSEECIIEQYERTVLGQLNGNKVRNCFLT